MKNFRITGTHKCRSLAVPQVPVQELPSTALPKLRRVKPYKPVPTTEQWRDWNNAHPDAEVTLADYTQHRQQDTGRAIALNQDSTNVLIGRTGNIWTFNNYYYSGSQVLHKTYTVNWNGFGTPPAGVSTTTYSQGRDYYRKDGTFVNLQGKPDKYTWAVWFLINGIPNDRLWQPVPSRNPQWSFAPTWVEYNLSL